MHVFVFVFIHAGHQRKVKNWEENDYYDSDEDSFLDRTGQCAFPCIPQSHALTHTNMNIYVHVRMSSLTHQSHFTNYQMTKLHIASAY